MSSKLDDQLDFLSTGLGYPAQWMAHREPTRRMITISFRCTNRVPTIHFSESAVVNARDATALIVNACRDLYERHHRFRHVSPELPPTVTCLDCRAPVSLVPEPTDAQALYEYCEQQAVRWMERAAAARKRCGG